MAVGPAMDEMPQALRELFKQAMAEKRKAPVPSPVTAANEMPLTIKELVEQSVPEESVPRSKPFTTRHLKVILHNTKLILELYRSGHPDPESHPDLKPQEAKYPLEFYKRFASSTESAIITQLEAVHPELYGYRMQHQEAELKMLREKVNMGLAEKGTGKVATGAGSKAEVVKMDDDIDILADGTVEDANGVVEKGRAGPDREADEIFFTHCAAPVS